ncbi:MAG TPA: hypothetical protein VL137_10270 [Polyangiaceae bacterium]|nr:hypothetical protein [Polyangiaceae bacterium]
MTSASAAAEAYSSRCQRYGAHADELGRRSALIGNLRGLFFGLTVILALWALFGSERALASSGAGLFLVLFIGAVVWHGRVLARQETALRFWYVNEHARIRTGSDWHTLTDQGASLVEEGHPYAGDLDLFGSGSVFQRFNVAHTRFGQRTLARLLGVPVTATEAQGRQSIVKSLVNELELRQELEARSLSLTLPRIWNRTDAKLSLPPDPEPLLSWAESAQLPEFTSLHLVAFTVLPALTLFGTALAFWAGASTWVWAIPLGIQIGVLFRYHEVTSRTFHSVSLGQGLFTQYGPMLSLLSQFGERVPTLAPLLGTLGDSHAPEQAMKEFARWVGFLELKLNPLVHPLADAFLLWDVHCLIALAKWQRRWGKKLRTWFEAIGEIEAYSSLAGIAHDNPDYCWPSFASEVKLEALQLAHPLINSAARVGNSVNLGGAQQALLITGSNMSGKSTYLRSLGLAQVMALAGAPVCAKSFQTSALVVRTSIRMSDSLEQGISHFYAELSKLKTVVETAHENGAVLFLLDEILHGTNSVERQIGARWVLSELLRCGSIGAVSTHDKGLCELRGELMNKVVQMHFRETVEGERMTFDYKLRPGPVAGGNALRLMRTLGLEVPLEPGP